MLRAKPKIISPPRLLTSCSALPPEGAVRLWPGKEMKCCPHGRSLRVASCPPRGPLRLRSGEASPAAPSGLRRRHISLPLVAFEALPSAIFSLSLWERVGVRAPRSLQSAPIPTLYA